MYRLTTSVPMSDTSPPTSSLAVIMLTCMIGAFDLEQRDMTTFDTPKGNQQKKNRSMMIKMYIGL